MTWWRKRASSSSGWPPSHVGLLIDVLVDPATDFAVRRRIPRILRHALIEPGARRPHPWAGRRALRSALSVRPRDRSHAGQGQHAHRGRAADVRARRTRAVRAAPGLAGPSTDRPARSGRGSRSDRPSATATSSTSLRCSRRSCRANRWRSHCFGIRSSNPGLRGLALEYLESVLPPPILARLWQVVDVPRAHAVRADVAGEGARAAAASRRKCLRSILKSSGNRLRGSGLKGSEAFRGSGAGFRGSESFRIVRRDSGAWVPRFQDLDVPASCGHQVGTRAVAIETSVPLTSPRFIEPRHPGTPEPRNPVERRNVSEPRNPAPEPRNHSEPYTWLSPSSSYAPARSAAQYRATRP